MSSEEYLEIERERMYRAGECVYCEGTGIELGKRCDVCDGIGEVTTREDRENDSTGFLITCPFCGETEFDKVGLWVHISRGWCDQYEEIAAKARAK